MVEWRGILQWEEWNITVLMPYKSQGEVVLPGASRSEHRLYNPEYLNNKVYIYTIILQPGVGEVERVQLC